MQLNIPEAFNAAAYFIDRHINDRHINDRHMADTRAQKVAFECGDERVTYGDLYHRVNQAGNALRSLGVRREERIAMLLLDTPDFAYCFFGGIKIGAVPVPLNTMLKPAEYEYMLNDSRARIAIVSAELLPQISAIPRANLEYLETIIVSRGQSLESAAAGTLSLQSIMNASPVELPAAKTSKDEPAFWLYSSGSTGFPKGCVHLHHDMVVCAEHYAKAVLGIKENDRFFSVAKLFFAYGLGNGLYFPLAVGATGILMPGSPSPPNIFSIIERHKPTLFFSVPSNYSSLLSFKRATPPEFDLSSIRWAVSAGEALPVPIFARFKERFGVEILDAIGSTEALHMFIANRPGAIRPGSSGQVIPGYEARIEDDHGNPVPDGEIGNLLIKGDAVCSVYWNQHEKSKRTIQGHWLRTGDKYYRDSDGYYWYVGRSDDMLKVKGMWVSPIEIESALIEHSSVQEAAVIGIADDNKLTRPAAYVVLREGEQGSDAKGQELINHLKSRLAAYKCPQKIEFVPQLPKTATGKIQRFKLRQGSV